MWWSVEGLEKLKNETRMDNEKSQMANIKFQINLNPKRRYLARCPSKFEITNKDEKPKEFNRGGTRVLTVRNFFTVSYFRP